MRWIHLAMIEFIELVQLTGCGFSPEDLHFCFFDRNQRKNPPKRSASAIVSEESSDERGK